MRAGREQVVLRSGRKISAVETPDTSLFTPPVTRIPAEGRFHSETVINLQSPFLAGAELGVTEIAVIKEDVRLC